MKKACALAIFAALALAGQAWAEDWMHGAPTIEGTWAVTLSYYYDGTTTGPSDNLQYLQQFHRDGRTVIYLPQVAGERFDETRTACAGEWRRRGHKTFDVTLYCHWTEIWADAPGVPDRILIKATMNRDGQGWTAKPFYYQPFVGGKYDGGPGWGEMKGVRLRIVPLP